MRFVINKTLKVISKDAHRKGSWQENVKPTPLCTSSSWWCLIEQDELTVLARGLGGFVAIKQFFLYYKTLNHNTEGTARVLLPFIGCKFVFFLAFGKNEQKQMLKFAYLLLVDLEIKKKPPIIFSVY